MAKLAGFFHAQNQVGKARPLYESALQIDRRYVGGVYTYASLPFLKRLAKAEGDAGDAKASEDLWEKSIQTEKGVFGPRHPQVALDLAQLAGVAWESGGKSRARKYLRESVDILKSHFPEGHPLVFQAQTQLEKFENNAPDKGVK
jgi:hypothetical protein